MRHKLLPVDSKSYNRVNFKSFSGREFSIMVQPILKRFTVLESIIQGLHFLLVQLVRHFCSLTRKWGSSGPTIIYALRNWLILICSETANASSFKNLHEIALDSLFMSTGNHVTSYFWSAENHINVFILGHVQVAISR